MPRVLSKDTIQELKQRVRGEIVLPEDTGYDAARNVYNAMHDCYPSLVLRAAGVADVIAGVNFARQQELLIAIRGGGHSVPGFGTCDDGLVIDLARMKGIRVDPERRTVRAEGGCTWGDFNHATYAFGMATTGGVVSTTGIAGLTLGGGMGYLSRRYGLSCDNLISADVVLADGTFVTCDEKQEPDLFWAIRGGGGNFGVVTSFEYRLHPIADVFGGVVFYPLDADIVRAYVDYITKAPEEAGIIYAFTKASPLPFLPADWHFKPIAAAVACWSGPIEAGEEALAPLKKWGTVVGSFLTRMPYPAINTLFDQLLPAGLQHYWKANFAKEVPDACIDVHLEYAAQMPSIESGMFFMPINGACQRIAADATAFAYRDVLFSNVISGSWKEPADNEKNIRWVRDYYQAITPYSEAAGYVNFMSHDDSDRVNVNYGKNHERLLQVKTKYDPKNLFRRNQNILPAG